LRKIKVIHIITRFDKGGSAENTLLTVINLNKARYDAALIKGLSLESEMGALESRAVEDNLAEAEKCGVRILTISELVREVRPLYDFKAFVSLIKIFLREKPVIVHTHTSKAGILGRWAAFLTQVPIIIHTPHGHVFWGYFSKRRTWFYVLLERLTALITDKIIMLTEQEKKDYLQFKIAPKDKFSTIHSGVDPDKYFNLSVDVVAMRRSLGIPDNSFVVGTAGRLTPVKGHRYLIEAAGRLVDFRPDTVFVFLGDGELLCELENMASRLGVKENVRFLGWRRDTAEVMSTFDLFVLPSLNEGMGRVLVEAMALGKPVVASGVGGISNLIVHGENGLLVRPADSRALAGSIKFLITDSEKRKQMEGKGKRIAVKYSVDSMVEKIDRLYVELLTTRRLDQLQSGH